VKNKKYPASKKSKMHNVWHPVKKKKLPGIQSRDLPSLRDGLRLILSETFSWFNLLGFIL
jgi:hypothetical protein